MGGGGGGYSSKIWVGGCGVLVTLFLSDQKYLISHLISVQTLKSVPFFRVGDRERVKPRHIHLLHDFSYRISCFGLCKRLRKASNSRFLSNCTFQEMKYNKKDRVFILKAIPNSRTGLLYFRPNRLKSHTLWRSTYLGS